MCKQLFEEIEERKHYFERLDAAYKRKKRNEAEKKLITEEIIQEDMKAWEKHTHWWYLDKAGKEIGPLRGKEMRKLY